jgi:hypothetical protein
MVIDLRILLRIASNSGLQRIQYSRPFTLQCQGFLPHSKLHLRSILLSRDIPLPNRKFNAAAHCYCYREGQVTCGPVIVKAKIELI